MQTELAEKIKNKETALNQLQGNYLKKLTDLKEALDRLTEASKKSANEILVFEKWKIIYERIFKNIYSEAHSITISAEDYMPIVNGIPINRVSSESMKLVAQLAYILSLGKLKDEIEDENVNSVCFMLFDSPKDKDLDNDKYETFLNELMSVDQGQIFLTGSVKEKEIYEKIFDAKSFSPYLSEVNKLLKNG